MNLYDDIPLRVLGSLVSTHKEYARSITINKKDLMDRCDYHLILYVSGTERYRLYKRGKSRCVRCGVKKLILYDDCRCSMDFEMDDWVFDEEKKMTWKQWKRRLNIFFWVRGLFK